MTGVGEQVKNATTGKRAPFLIGGLGLVVLYLWWTRGRVQAAADTAAATDTGVLPTGDIARVPAGAASGSTATTSTTETPFPDVPPATNDQWALRAISWLVAHLFTGEFAQAAVQKALAGEALTIPEMSAVGMAIAGIGPPPQGMPPLTGLPPVDKSPAPTPAPTATGLWFTIPAGYVPAGAQGTSQVFDRLAREHGYPAVLTNPTNAKTRTVSNRAAVDAIWYALPNVVPRAKYGNDWTKLRSGDRIWIPAKAA